MFLFEGHSPITHGGEDFLEVLVLFEYLPIEPSKGFSMVWHVLTEFYPNGPLIVEAR